jgi:hypothetical protein
MITWTSIFPFYEVHRVFSLHALSFSLMGVVTESNNYTKLSKKIIHRSRRFSKLKPI